MEVAEDRECTLERKGLGSGEIDVRRRRAARSRWFGWTLPLSPSVGGGVLGGGNRGMDQIGEVWHLSTISAPEWASCWVAGAPACPDSLPFRLRGWCRRLVL